MNFKFLYETKNMKKKLFVIFVSVLKNEIHVSDET